MRVLIPTKITPAILVSTTATEPAADWVSGATYAVGATVKRTTVQRLFRRFTAGTGTVAPELDTTTPPVWIDGGPTNDYAMFDVENYTFTTGPPTLTVVLNPGYFNALYLSGLLGNNLTVTVRETPGGAVIFSYTASFVDRLVSDWYDYFFTPFVQRKDLVLEDIPPSPTAQVTVTITGTTTTACASLDVGNMFLFGSTEYGAKARLKSYSTTKTDFFGKLSTVKRYSAKTMTATVLMDLNNAIAAQAVLDDLDAINAVWIATTINAYGPLRVRGLADGEISFDEVNNCKLNLTVTGTI